MIQGIFRFFIQKLLPSINAAGIYLVLLLMFLGVLGCINGVYMFVDVLSSDHLAFLQKVYAFIEDMIKATVGALFGASFPAQKK